mgnify:CR=1 FL=1
MKKDFPMFKTDAGMSADVYLDSAATAQKPRAVIEAISAYYREDNANVHRAQYSLAGRATAAYEGARSKIRNFINARSEKEIIFTGGTTQSINTVAWTIGRTLVKGSAVLLTEMEHHSNLIPWQLLAKERELELRFIPFDEAGELDMEAAGGLLNKDVGLVSVTHMSNVFGTVNDIKAIVKMARVLDIPVLVDGAQAVPHIPVDAQNLGCDFYAFSGHKMCGPTGIGVLYGREEILDKLEPFMGGGEMISSVWLDHARWNDLPYKFEAGTPNIAGAVGLGAAVDYLTCIGMDEIQKAESSLTAYALDMLAGVTGLTIYGKAAHRGGVISFNLDTVHAHDVAQFLDSRGVSVRAGHHCAHPIMRKLGIPSTARASLYLYNTTDDVDRLAKALIECREFFTNGL